MFPDDERRPAGDRPGGARDFFRGPGDFPPGAGDLPSRAGDFPLRAGDFSPGAGVFLERDGDLEGVFFAFGGAGLCNTKP